MNKRTISLLAMLAIVSAAVMLHPSVTQGQAATSTATPARTAQAGPTGESNCGS